MFLGGITLKVVSILLRIIGVLALVLGITLFFTGHEFLGIVAAIISFIIFPSRRSEAKRSSSIRDRYHNYYSNDYNDDSKKDNDSTTDVGDSGDSGRSD